MKQLPFVKMHGAGNDFIMVLGADLVKSEIVLTANNIANLCHRQFGVGADGLIIISNSKLANFKMIYFNSDGYEAEMCGNGARCAYAFARAHNLVPDTGVFEASGVVLDGAFAENGITVSLPTALEPKIGMKSDNNDILYDINFANTGVPHAVIFANDIDGLDLQSIGSLIRNDSLFAPDGANVNFVESLGNNSFVIRTYERGVEAETLACGTGAAASALIATHLDIATSPVKLTTKSGDELFINITNNNDKYELALTGPAVFAFKGEVTIDD